MRLKRLFLPLFCLVFVCCLLVGSGFAFFFFDGNHAENTNQVVTVSPEAHVELGTVSLVEEGHFYQVLLDVAQVHLFRHDNSTTDASFALRCHFADHVQIPNGYRVALACDVILADEDARGVYFATNGEYSYAASRSLVDYIVPTKALSGTGGQSDFSLLEGDASTKSMTYRCVLFEDVYTATSSDYTSPSFQLRFDYRDYEVIDSVGTYRGSMSPSGRYQSGAEYEQIMADTRSAQSNASIRIVFRLILQKEVP